ncbi:MAG: tRNA glutamyl-Q(34) synthetase GluQRS [Proteobacteria bacterium ST_bin12]|nr:MAG: tRNA glutamyl-Q(34) synthetase GluQRS [Proteobacteria bacterium ST_bin12]
MQYIGRFAPSPTGPLHFGSLVAAVASYCDAKLNQGKWLLRLEDLDKPREIPGATDIILQQLDAFGFEWDGEIVRQSQRNHYYAQALDNLHNQHLIYPCTCTRKEIADSSNLIGIDGFIYPKTCLEYPLKTNKKPALRIRVNNSEITFHDAIQGDIHQNLQNEVGDFVIKRADDLFTYQLAVVVDDAAQGVTHVVRGADLLNSTPRQIYLQQCLTLPTPHYAHMPIARNAAGEKLSKQTLAKPIDATLSAQQLFEALQFLGQKAPTDLQFASLPEIWQWAIAHWQRRLIPAQDSTFKHYADI